MFLEDRYLYEKYPKNFGYYEMCFCPINQKVETCCSTVYINLLADEDVILQSFNSTVRNEIRRCEKEDNPKFELNCRPSLYDIEDLLILYEEFAKSKHLESILDGNILFYRNYLGLLARNNCLVIAKAFNNDKSCVVVDALFMSKDSETARLNVSVSNFRYEDKEHQKINSRINKWLKFEECKYFKSCNLKYYDLGGAQRDKVGDISIDNVRSFKLSFSDKFVTYYAFSYYKPKSWWHNFREKYFRKNASVKLPKICLLFDEKVDDRAYEIVNQLAKDYCFDIRLWNNYKKHNDYDLVHILDKNLFDKNVGSTKTIKQGFELNNIGISPLEYFYAKNKTGDMKIFVQLDRTAKSLAVEGGGGGGVQMV